MSRKSNPHTTMTLAQVGRADELTFKARAIVACIRAAATQQGELPDDAIPGACWAAEDMIQELGSLCHGKRAKR